MKPAKRFLSMMLVGVLALAVGLSVDSVAGASTPTGTTLNGHTVMVDGQGKIVPWNTDTDAAYDQVLATAWNYLLNSVPNGASGLPLYRTNSYMDPNTQRAAGWPNNPAGMNAMFIESALAYYAYSGNPAVLAFATGAADFDLAHGLTLPTDSWAGVPYASGDSDSTTYQGASYGNTTGVGDGSGILEPDKMGELGYQLLRLYEVTGSTRYRDEAMVIGNQLSSHVRTGTASQSPWPFRTSAAANTIREQYTADVIGPISLLDELIRLNLGNVATYVATRATAWNWLMTYPMQNNVWSQYFEDVPIQSSYSSNLSQYVAMMTARYLLLHPEFDPGWEAHVRGLIAWVESHFSVASLGANTIREQNAFPHAMGSHTSRYASVNALLYERTGDLAAKEKAYRAYNWATYMERSNGVVIDGPEVNNEWFTDSYGDYIRHFMIGLGAVPEWAPSGQTHLLQASSAVKSVDYSSNQVSYTTFEGTGTDTLKMAAAPSAVSANGVSLAQVSDLSTGNGYTYDPSTGVLKLRHDGATQISIITNGLPGNVAPTISITTPTNGATFAAPATVNLTASAADSDGAVTKVDFYSGAALLGTATSAPYGYSWANVAAGSYNLSAKATDNSGAVTSSSPVAVTVTGSGSLPGGWSHQDIGAVGVAGDASQVGGTYTVKGSGVDIWGAADSFHYAYLPLTGDGSITAHVAGQQNTDPWALAGLMIRETLAANSRHALAALTPGNGFAFTRRTTVGGTSSYTSGGAGTVTGGAWLRVTRAGNLLTGYKSTNGTTWTSVGSVTMSSLASSVYVGLAVASHVNSVLATDTFDHVTTTSTGDVTPPVISGVGNGTPDQQGVSITWTTNEPADSQVDYGTSSSYGSSTSRDTSLVTTHTQLLAALNAGTTYHYRVRSTDASGNPALSSDFTFTTSSASDTLAPTIPTGLTASAVSPTEIDVSWTAASDDVGVTKYVLQRDGATIAQPTGTRYADTTVAPATSHTYTVAAVDGAGNSSAPSDPAAATTPADTSAPTVPAGLTAVAVSSTQVNLSWTGASDNVGVTRYNILRFGTQIGTATGTTYSDTTTNPGTAYSYTVTAQDAAGNVSTPSNTASVSTPATGTLAIDTQVLTHGTSSAASISSPALTTAGVNELLVAFISSDGGSTTGSSSFSSVTGGRLTWTLRKRVNAQAGTSEIWTAPAAARVTAAVVTATRSGSYRSSIVVAAFKGASLTTIGATGGASASSGAPIASLTTTRAGSWVWAVGNDWDNATARTVGGSQTKVDEFLTASGDTLWAQRQTSLTSSAGTVVTVNDTAPTTDRWNLALIEIPPAP